ncbi:hypothetical protein V1525DRAFT_400745 [Lipomyces kononenkoae]|uniref:Uncharacterized protein n=1 Tax=Lipomyces kononenkoae TaxID=34357 RepID=A0ACC3T3L4_LIPKO
MTDSKKETGIDAGAIDAKLANTAASGDEAPKDAGIDEGIKSAEETASSVKRTEKSDATDTQSRKRSLDELSPPRGDVDDADIPADNTLKRPRAGDAAIKDDSDSKVNESSELNDATENYTADRKANVESEAVTDDDNTGSTTARTDEQDSGSVEKTEIKATASPAKPTGPQNEKIEDTAKDKDKSSQNGAGDEKKPPALFASSLSSGSLFGSTSSPSPFAFKGKSVFASSSRSDKPMPFSEFSSNNPFLNALSKDNSKANDNEDSGDGEDENENDSADNFDKPYIQLNLEKKKVETGEEMETSIFNCRAKLYVLDPTEADKGWKERGVGVLHLNVRNDDSVTATDTPEPSSTDESKESTPAGRERKSKARIVMRADGVLKVILNLPLVKGIEVMKGMKSSLASEKFVRISAWENHKPIQYALRMGNENVATEFYDAAEGLINS